MSQCLCPQCRDSPPLTYRDDYRAQCEARYVVVLVPSARNDYWRIVRKKRGRSAAARLVADVKAMEGEKT